MPVADPITFRKELAMYREIFFCISILFSRFLPRLVVIEDLFSAKENHQRSPTMMVDRKFTEMSPVFMTIQHPVAS